jgi:hypothetical protein
MEQNPEPEAGQSAPKKAASRNNADRLFGYDVFICFALGPAPRGTQSYASDLARRLRERDFTVFFSEKEVPPGAHLSSALQKVLANSKTFVVIANKGKVKRPGWVRTEMEEAVRDGIARQAGGIHVPVAPPWRLP